MERLDGNTHRIQRFVRSREGEFFGTRDASGQTGVPARQTHPILDNMQCVQVNRRGRWRGGNRYQSIGKSREKGAQDVFMQSMDPMDV